MSTSDLPLFAAAGIELEERPAPVKARRRRVKPATPAERAASGRLHGARRSRCPCDASHRVRIGSARDLSPRKVFGFPLSRNASVLGQALQGLPHFYADNFEKKWSNEGRKWERRLVKSGIPKDEAYESAYELLHAALDVRATQAHKELGIL